MAATQRQRGNYSLITCQLTPAASEPQRQSPGDQIQTAFVWTGSRASCGAKILFFGEGKSFDSGDPHQQDFQCRMKKKHSKAKSSANTPAGSWRRDYQTGKWVQSRRLFNLPQTSRNKQKDGAAHFVGGVLGVWLALGCPAGHGAGTDVAEVDLALRGRAASRLAPNNDGAAWQDLRRGGEGVNHFQNLFSEKQTWQLRPQKPESHMDGKKKWASALSFFLTQRVFITNEYETCVWYVANHCKIKVERGFKCTKTVLGWQWLNKPTSHSMLSWWTAGRDHTSW